MATDLFLLLLMLGVCQQSAVVYGLGLDMASGDSYYGKTAAAAAASSGLPPQKLPLGLPVASNEMHSQMNKFLPDGISRADKIRSFLECRKECIAKCDRLVYVYSTKKEFCHDCIRQCMVAVLQQARSLGIDFNTGEERMQGDAPDSGKRDRRRRRKKNKRNRRQRQQKLLKNCIVH